MTTKEELAEKLTGIFENSIQQMAELIEDYAEGKKNDTAEAVEPEQYGLWKPKEGERFYYVVGNGILQSTFEPEPDKGIVSIGNCFKTQEEAEKHLEHLKVETQLRDIAARLNKGREIDYDLASQRKYYLYYMQNGSNDINQDYNETARLQGTILCLDSNFKDVAIAEIGEDRLKEYLKNG